MHGQLLPLSPTCFLGSGKRRGNGEKNTPPLTPIPYRDSVFLWVGALTAVTFAHVKIIALLWKTEPDLNATFINFTNSKRLLNMRQVNMTSRRLWQSEIDGFKSLLEWKMPLEILSPAGLRFMPKCEFLATRYLLNLGATRRYPELRGFAPFVIDPKLVMNSTICWNVPTHHFLI